MSERSRQVRADLDAAIAAALPLAGFRIRDALVQVRDLLAEVDRRNDEFREPLSVEPVPAQYLIWSHDAGAWWGPNGSGYTGDITRAGRYELDDANTRAGLRSWPSPTEPPEVVVSAPSPSLLASPSLHRLMKSRIEGATLLAVMEKQTGARA